MRKLTVKKAIAFLASYLASLFLLAKPALALELTDYFVLGKEGSKPVSGVYDTPAKLINVVIRNLFVIAGIILFFMIVYAGFQLVRNDKKGVEEAKSIITVAITGFVLMLAAFWIVQIVKLLTGVDIIL